jgi:hypothetical protein
VRDNAALMTISEDQKRIALAAKQDSAAVRVISVITIVFLPATFTSVSYKYLNPHVPAKCVHVLEPGEFLCFKEYRPKFLSCVLTPKADLVQYYILQLPSGGGRTYCVCVALALLCCNNHTLRTYPYLVVRHLTEQGAQG